MKILCNRIAKIEKAISGDAGIPAWAKKVAEMEARYEPSRIQSMKELQKAIRAAGGEVENDTPEPRLSSRSAVEAYARQLSQKYRNDKEFSNRPIEPEDLKRLTAAIAAAKL